ncbi:MAG: RNase adapter RapZ [Pseudomonadota bacterium]|nr:RNase adapter RapZ [Pseudomonadota bacterium]
MTPIDPTLFPPRRRIVILTGMSGAGLSTALKVFEDLGYEAVDNLRLTLISALVENKGVDKNTVRPLAIAADTRNANFAVDDLLNTVKKLEEKTDCDVKLVFLECSDEALERRFTETRRRHPLAIDRPVTDGIRREREMLWRLRDAADHVIDTSLLSIHELRRLIAGHYRVDGIVGLTLFITSFSYRHGVPREADLVFDVRFLANPHWDLKLRPLTGKDPAVQNYIRSDPDYAAFMEHMSGLLLPLLPRYQQEGKSYLTIAAGCTGGRHRSVFVAEELATCLATHDYIVGVGHRDLDRAANKA